MCIDRQSFFAQFVASCPKHVSLVTWLFVHLPWLLDQFWYEFAPASDENNLDLQIAPEMNYDGTNIDSIFFSELRPTMESQSQSWAALSSSIHRSWTSKSSNIHQMLWRTSNHHSFFRPMGMPILRKVRVHNLNSQNSIQMLSISGNTIHFHCSFFADKVLLQRCKKNAESRQTFLL